MRPGLLGFWCSRHTTCLIEEIISCTSQHIIARISPAPSPNQWMTKPLRSRWLSDPLVLDCAFQLSIIWCYEQKGMLCLPAYSHSYRQYCRSFPTDGVTAILEVEENSSRTKLKGKYTFLDSEKRVVATIDGFEAVIDSSLYQAFQVEKPGAKETQRA